MGLVLLCYLEDQGRQVLVQPLKLRPSSVFIPASQNTKLIATCRHLAGSKSRATGGHRLPGQGLAGQAIAC